MTTFTIETNLSGTHEIVSDLGIVRLRNGTHTSSFTVRETGELIAKLTLALRIAKDRDDHRELGARHG